MADIFGDAEVRKQVELLIDDADSQALRVERTLDFDRFAVEENSSGVRANRSGDDFRERAFSRAVFTHQGVHFPGGQRKIRAAQRLHAIVVFMDSFGAHKGIA